MYGEVYGSIYMVAFLLNCVLRLGQLMMLFLLQESFRISSFLLEYWFKRMRKTGVKPASGKSSPGAIFVFAKQYFVLLVEACERKVRWLS